MTLFVAMVPLVHNLALLKGWTFRRLAAWRVHQHGHQAHRRTEQLQSDPYGEQLSHRPRPALCRPRMYPA
jgi:hypothetical protein